MTILIKNGHVVDPLTRMDGDYDVLIEDNRIKKVAATIEEEAGRSSTRRLLCYARFIDLHVHFRDPGLEYKETLKTGGAAAVRGGVTTVCAMPNTKPVIDDGPKSEMCMKGQKRTLLQM